MFTKHALIALAAIVCLSLAAPARCHAQRADTIHVGWQAYAFDTSPAGLQLVLP